MHTFNGFGLTHTSNLHKHIVAPLFCEHYACRLRINSALFTVPSRGGVMSSRTSQQAAISGPMRGSTTAHAHPTNPHCCACNNAIAPNINNSNASYTNNHGHGGMYHGNPGMQNHNSHSQIQQNQDMYHNSTDRVVASSSHSQRHHHNNQHNYGTREFQRMAKPSIQDATQYYICECTSCRNLGNSVDICCQCCNCGNMTATIVQDDHEEQEIISDYASSRGYHVSSVALTGDTDDTLEVVFDDGEAVTEVIDEHSNSHKMDKTCNNVEAHHHVHRDDETEISDDISYAHNVAESSHNPQGRQLQKHSACLNCNSCSCSGKPVFQGWASHHINPNNQHSNPHHQQQQHPQQHQQNMYQNKTNTGYHHHHHHTSQGAIHTTNQQNCAITSPQQHNIPMNSRVVHNHHGHPSHPNYNHPHSPNNARIPNQGRSNNTHHSKHLNNRVQKSHLCCSQGKKEPC